MNNDWRWRLEGYAAGVIVGALLLVVLRLLVLFLWGDSP